MKNINISTFLVLLFFSTISFYGYTQPVIGNITQKFLTPGSQKSFSHVHSSATDTTDLLVVITQVPNGGANVKNVKYGNVLLESGNHWVVAGWRNRVWYLPNPPKGNNNVVINLYSYNGNKCAFIALSFTETDGIGETGIDNTGGDAVEGEVTLDVKNNSRIVGFGLGTAQAINSFSLVGDPARLWDVNLCCSKRAFGAVSDPLSAGDQILSAKDNNGTVYPMAIEILPLNSSATTLPIDLIEFTSTVTENNFIQLNWQTGSELNNDYFTIERSKNIGDWEEVKRITGAGNSNALLNYNSIDEAPYPGTSYYRLKQTDFDGKFEYSPISTVNVTENQLQEIFIYPNPTTGIIIVEVNKNEWDNIVVYDVMGNDVTNLTTKLITGELKLSIDLSLLSTGVYFIKTKTTMNKVQKQ